MFSKTILFVPVVGRCSLMATQDSIYLGKGGMEGGGRENKRSLWKARMWSYCGKLRTSLSYALTEAKPKPPGFEQNVSRQIRHNGSWEDCHRRKPHAGQEGRRAGVLGQPPYEACH